MAHEVKVEFKTSELVIMDRVRIPEFNDEVDYWGSINSDEGMIASTENAASHGYVYVHVGDCDLTVFRKENDFSFELKDEKKDHVNIGSVSICVWAVTMIETQKLIDIVANKVGHEKAKEKVDTFLKSKPHMKINVEPGNYTVKYSPKSFNSFRVKKTK